MTYEEKVKARMNSFNGSEIVTNWQKNAYETGAADMKEHITKEFLSYLDNIVRESAPDGFPAAYYIGYNKGFEEALAVIKEKYTQLINHDRR